MRRLTVLVAVIAGLIGGLPGTAVAQEDDGLLLEVHTTYEMRPDDGDVSVELEVTATNTLTDATDQFGVTRYYFDEVVFAIPIEAVDVVASDAGGELAVEVEPRPVDGIAEASIALRSRLYSGENRPLTLTFRLEASPPRSEGDIRVDSAYGWFFLWAYGDPEHASVTAVIPSEFDVDVIGDPLRQTIEEGGRVYRAEAIGDPFAWVSVISARNDRALVSSSFEVAGREIRLEAWPSDPDWALEVERLLTDGIPILSNLTGRAWTTDVVITESIEPSIHGYGGWYDGEVDEIEIGEELDAHLVLHEISHAWFDEGLFTDRFITEGLADVYADAAVEEIGENGWEQDVVTRAGRGNLPLVDWGAPTFDDRTLDAEEDYGYAASWLVIDAVVDEIGFERMRDVLTAAWSDTIAYRGEAAFDYVAPRDDWRRFLDLAEEVGGSTQALSLFDTWVVDEVGKVALTDRFAARSDYQTLEDAAGSWALPPDLRRAMSDWDFAAAEAEIAEALGVIEARDRLTEIVRQAGLAPPSLESRFEAGEDGSVLSAELEAQTVVAEDIAEALAVATEPRSVIESLGMIGLDPNTEAGTARTLFAAGELEEARSAADRIVEWSRSAAERGRVRVGATTGVAGLAIAGGWLVVRSRRRRRHELPDPATETVSTF